MGDKSNIEWTDATWNPVVGCSIVSPGCTNCYAMKMAARIEKMASSPMAKHVNVQTHYVGTTQQSKSGAVWTGKVALAPDHILTAPLRWKKPRKIFVNSMGDLFHESIPDEWIDRVFAVMALCPQHTFQVLTKRAERMRQWMIPARAHSVGMVALEAVLRDHAARDHSMLGAGVILVGDIPHLKNWPLPNVWLGVSCELQQEADERIPLLLQTPAAIRFISAEPLLGPIDLVNIEAPDKVEGERWTFDALTNGDYYTQHDPTGESPMTNGGDGPYREHALDWIIVGGESGAHARPFHLEWAIDLLDQCRGPGIPCFIKQLGDAAQSSGYPYPLKKRKGGDLTEWPDALQVREMPA
jgi:protein gp37